MRKLILEEWISLDGHVTDANGQLDFFSGFTPEQNTYSDQSQLKFLESVDLILLGRKTYELFVDFWPTATTDKEVIADRLNEIPKMVVSNTLTEAPWGHWPAANLMHGDTPSAIRELKQKPGKDIVLWGSISLAQSLMKENLIDEYHLQLCPIVTGGGRKLFIEPSQVMKMHLADVRKYNMEVVFLDYRIE